MVSQGRRSALGESRIELGISVLQRHRRSGRAKGQGRGAALASEGRAGWKQGGKGLSESPRAELVNAEIPPHPNPLPRSTGGEGTNYFISSITAFNSAGSGLSGS